MRSTCTPPSSSLSPLSIMLNSAHNYKRQHAQLRECYDELVTESEKREEHINELKSTLTNELREKENLNYKIKSLNEKLAHFQQFEVRCTELEAAMVALQKKLAVSEANSARLTSSLTRIDIENRDLFAKNERLEDENETMRRLLDDLRQKLNDELATNDFTRQKNNELEAQLSGLEMSWQKRMDKLNEDFNQRLELRVSDLTKRLVTAKAESNTLSERYAVVNQELIATRARADTFEAESTGRLEHINNVKRDLDDALRRFAVVEAERDELIRRLDAEKRTVNEKINAISQSENLQRKCREFAEKFRFMEENFSNLSIKKDKSIEAARREVEKLSERCATLEEELRTHRDHAMKSERRCDELNATVVSTQFECNQERRRVKELEAALETAKERINQYENEENRRRRKELYESRNAQVNHHLRDHYSLQTDVHVNSPTSQPFSKSNKGSFMNCVASPYHLFRHLRSKKGSQHSTPVTTTPSRNRFLS